MKVGDLVRYKPHYSCEGKIGMLLELLPKEDLDSEFAWKVIWSSESAVIDEVPESRDGGLCFKDQCGYVAAYRQ